MKFHNWVMTNASNVRCTDCDALDCIGKDPLDSEGIASEVLRIQRRTDCDIIIAKKAVHRILKTEKHYEGTLPEVTTSLIS